MKKYNLQTEIRTIKSMLNGKKAVRQKLFATVQKEHIGFKHTREVYDLLMSGASEAKDIPKASVLSHDPSLSDGARDVILSELKPFSERDVDSALQTLERYRKGRITVKGLERSLQSITENNDPDTAERELEKTLFRLRSTERSQLMHGKEHVEVTKRVLNEKLPNLIRTGFKYYDRESGGWSRTGVVLLTSHPGGMKSQMMMKIATHQFLYEDEDVCIVSLEMNEEECIERQMCFLAKVPFRNIHLRTMKPEEKKKILKKSKLIYTIERKTGRRFTIVHPNGEISFTQLMNTLSPFKYKIIYIDYISLLANPDKIDEWRLLKDISRMAKIWAKKLNCCIVLLAQVDDKTGELRYGRGTRDNADSWWRWNLNEDDKEAGVFTVEQPKARHSEQFDFRMGLSMKYMDFLNIDQNASGNAKTESEAKASYKDNDSDIDMDEEEF